MLLEQDTLFDDRYLLKKILGCGGFSEVWLVEDIKVGNKKMALKIYAPDKGLDADGVQIFSSEFELVFDLNHTNLLHPAHFDVCDHSPYLLMPYCEQGSASKLVGHLSEEDAWRFLHDVASGLAYLHDQNPPIIHQDIKPDNILRDTLGNFQITDFGISTKVRSTLRKSVSNVTSGGTLAYMPPERFGKENIPIKASDIWAMGATVFELLTGNMPFSEHGGLIQKSGAEIPDMPGEHSKELREIISRCLRKEPWDRPVAQQIVKWTEQHLKGEEIVFDTEKPESVPDKKNVSAGIIARLNKKIVLAIAGGFLLLLVAFIIIKIFTPPAQPAYISVVESEEYIPIEPDEVDTDLPADLIDLIADETPPAESVLETQTPETLTPATSAPVTPAWLTNYNRFINLAQTAAGSKNYVKAKEEYTNALNLANQNRDSEKTAFVTGKIAECDKAIEEATSAARQTVAQTRLEAYNFVGNFKLGSTYLIVQRKSDNRWGIITLDGTEAEAFGYTQVSALLKNNNYALKNDEGWVVFDTSLKKMATALENLNDYR